MTSASRRTMAAGALAGGVVLIGLTLIPTHVSLGAGSLRCGTVWHSDRTSEIARSCGKAGAHQLRTSLKVGAVLACLGLLPMLIGRLPNRRRRVASAIWIPAMLVGAAAALLVMAVSEYTPRGTPPRGALPCDFKAGDRITADVLGDGRSCDVTPFDCADGRIHLTAKLDDGERLEGFAPTDQSGNPRPDTRDAVWQEYGGEYQGYGRTKLQFDCGG